MEKKDLVVIPKSILQDLIKVYVKYENTIDMTEIKPFEESVMKEALEKVRGMLSDEPKMFREELEIMKLSKKQKEVSNTHQATNKNMASNLLLSDVLSKAESWWNKLEPFDNIRLCEKYKWRNIFISNKKLIEIYEAEQR